MKLVIACALVLSTAFAHAAPLPKDCPRAFVKAWEARASAAALPKPRAPCVLHGETGIYLCDDRGCVRP